MTRGTGSFRGEGTSLRKQLAKSEAVFSQPKKKKTGFCQGGREALNPDPEGMQYILAQKKSPQDLLHQHGGPAKERLADILFAMTEGEISKRWTNIPTLTLRKRSGKPPETTRSDSLYEGGRDVPLVTKRKKRRREG